MAPEGTPPAQRKNFLNVQVDAVGIGLASAAAPFLPVFLARLGASNFEVGLLIAMPAFTGLFVAIAVGRFLQSRRQIVPWFSAARLMVVSSYALTGIVPFFFRGRLGVIAILLIWAVVTLPQMVVSVSFSVVMNAVAGPQMRYDLMSRRWSILGFTTALAVVMVSVVLDRVGFPVNYQAVFLALSVGGIISYYYSSHIDLPDSETPPQVQGRSLRQRFSDYVRLIWNERPFVSFALRRFIFLTGSAVAAPLLPLYYVRVVGASDGWIGIINTSQTAVMLIGYFLWSHQSRSHGSRFVLLTTTLALSLSPALIASTQRVEWVSFIAGLSGLFQAGIDLVFFDELMKTVPEAYAATFISLAQSVQYLSLVVAPLAATLLADRIGIGGALWMSAGIRLAGFVLFVLAPAAQRGSQPHARQDGSP